MNSNEIAKGHWAYSLMDEVFPLKSYDKTTKYTNIPYKSTTKYSIIYTQNTHIKETKAILVDYGKELGLFFMSYCWLPYRWLVTSQMNGYLTDDCASDYPV